LHSSSACALDVTRRITPALSFDDVPHAGFAAKPAKTIQKIIYII